MAQVKYQVTITREDDAWLADVTNLAGAHTYARNLVALRKYVDEVIRLVEDLDDDTPVEMEWTYEGLDAGMAAAAQLGAERARLERELALLSESTWASVATLQGQGVSVRDIGGLLGVSPGRVSQLTRWVSRSSESGQIVSNRSRGAKSELTTAS
jgi:hypothetical protein